MSKVIYQKRSFRQKLLASLSMRFRHHVETCVDLRQVCTDPLDAAYLSPDTPFVIDVPTAHCRGFHALAFPLGDASPHPFIATVHAIRSGLTDFAASPLAAYYRAVQPASAADLLGLPMPDAHAEFRATPLRTTLPWEPRSPVEAQGYWEKACLQDYRQHGFPLGLRDGWKGWGPLSDRAVEAEFTRLLRIVRSVQSVGYARHSARDGDIQGRILKRGAHTRVLLGAGQHRAAVLAALGYKAIPVRLDALVADADESVHWPNVRRGYFTSDQARSVFNRVFEGRQPAFLGPAAKPIHLIGEGTRTSRRRRSAVTPPVPDGATRLSDEPNDSVSPLHG